MTRFITRVFCTLFLLTMCIAWGANAQNAAPTGKQTKGIISEGVITPESYDAFENRSCDPVQDLTGSRNQHAGIDLTWKNPDGYNEYILQWDRDICHSAAGTSDGFYYATLYHKSQLTAYAGKTIRRVGFLPYMPNDDNATATIQLCIWATELAYVRPDAPLYTQTITNYTPGEWTNVELNTPFSIPPGKNIYIGFYTTYTGIQHPATFNYGAGANGFSNLISSTGAFFTSYMYNGTVVSWLIHTIISDQPANKGYDANKLITLPSHVESGALSTTTFNKRGIAINTTAISTNKSTTGLKGYSVYRDNELIKTTSVTGYRDIFVPQGDHQYTVKALYDGSCTESTPVTVTVTDPCTTPQIGTLPYQEGFENGFQCWGQELIEGDPFSPTSWISRTGSPYSIFSAHSGTLNAYFSGDYLHSSALLISPRMEFLPTSTPYLTFFHMNQRYQEGTDIYRDTLKVYYRAGSTQTWTLLETYDIADTWTKRTIVLPNPGANYQIAFKGIAAWGSGILLDDIAVTDGDPCDVPVSLNLEEGFNTPAFPPACWTSLNIGGSGTGYFQTIDAGIGILPACTPHSGAGMLRYRSAVQTAGAKAQLITPLLDLPNDSYTVSFWVFRDEMPAKQDRINIYFNTEKNTNGLTPLITVHRARSLAPATTVSGWHEYRVDFNCPTTNTGYVIIEAVSDYGYDIHLDDILIGNLCMPITNLDFTTNGNNVSLSWNVPEVSVGFMGYNIYRNDTFITTITDVETTTFTDNNLSQGGYTYCVEAAYNNTCGAAPAVCTPNIAITNSGSCNRPRGVTFVAHQPEHYNVKLIWYPPQSTAKSMSIFEEGFNSGIPNSWKNMDKDGDGNQWKHSSQYTGGAGTPAPYAGDGCAISQSYLYGGTILTPDNWLISPAIDIVGKCELKYYVGSVGTDYAEHYGLYVSTTGTDYDNFTLIQEETLTSAAWKEHIVDLSAYSGRTVYFAFRHFNCSNQFIFKLDEVSVTMVDDASIVGYNVYRDNVKINKTVVTTSEYLDLVSAAGNYTYGVTAIWPDYCESAQTRVNVYMPGSQCAMPIYLPMMEGFNEDPFPKQCWTNEVDGARQWRRVTSGTNPTCSPHTGAGMIMFQSLDYSAGITLKLITPMLQVDDAGDYFRYKISFWMYRESRQYASSERADKVNLYLNQTPSSTDLDPILTVHRYIALSPVVAAEGWYKYEVEVDRPFDVGYVMIEGVSAWGRNIYVDDLSVDGWAIPAPACNPPTALTPTVTGRSVSLTWTAPAVGTPTGYNVFRNNELQETVTTTSYTCDYVSNGNYTYCVTALYATPCESTPVCVNNVVVNSDVPCDAPENVSVNMAAYNGSCGAQITWTAPSTGGNSFNVYRDGTKIASGITATSYTDTGFSPGEHNWCVTTTCDTDESLEVCATGTCTVPTFTITATAGENGTITPSGEITVNYGDNQTFTITANSGYRIARVLVNNVNYPASASAGSHTFTNVKGNATITATFGPIPMVSTEEDPIWYFMENGATPDVNNGVERSGLLLTSTGTTSTTYTNVNVLNINSDRDAQLWRLQDEGDDFVSVINKKTGNKLTLSGSYYTNIPNAVVGDRFYIQPYTDLARVRLKRNSKVVTTHLGCYNAGTQWRTYNQSESAQMTDTWTFYTESDYFDTHIYPELSSATNEKWYFIESASTIAGMTGSVITQTDAVGSPVKWLDKIETEGSEQDKQLWKAVSVEGSTQNVNFINKATGNYLIKVENIAQGTTTDASGAGYLIKYLAEGQFNLVSTDRSTTTQGRVGVKAADDNVITKTASTDGPYRNTGGAWKFISATPAVVCNPPLNVAVAMSPYSGSCIAEITWTAPETGENTFNVYRDGVKIASNLIATSYTDLGFATGEHTWCVTTVCGETESTEVCATETCTAPTYTITATAGENGTITPTGNVTVAYGANQTFTFSPAACYQLDQVLINGVNNAEAVANGSYTFTNVTDNQTIAVSFKVISSTITATAGENGTITPSGAVSVDCGTDKTFTITPNEGYKIAQVLVDGVNNATAVNSGSYTFTNVTTAHTIEATFEQLTVQYTITATAGTGGTITPSGNVIVNQGNDQTFTITPNEGYKITQVLVDGVNNATAVTSGSYTFTNVTTAHTIEATFEQLTVQYTITATAGSNGSIDPEGAITVNEGDNQTFTFTADNGYEVDQLLVDNVNIADSIAGGNYTFKNVTEDHIIAVTFKIIPIPTYTITATAGENGSIDPTGNVVVNHGDDQTFTITPNEGYKIAQVLVDGVNNTEAVASGSYTFTDVTAAHTIEATFEQRTYIITATAGKNGSIDPMGIISVAYGDNKTFVITPDEEYQITQVLIDGVNNAAAVTSGSYTFNNITGNHTIEARFKHVDVQTATINVSYGAGGKVSPNGLITVSAGENKTFTIMPNNGYKINQVLIDGVNDEEAVATGTYTFENVTEDHSLVATFTYISGEQYFITASSGTTGGVISPNGKVTVMTGDDYMFTITPNAGYKIKEVLVDGVNNPTAVEAGFYIFENITASHTIVAKYEKQSFTIMASVDGIGGTITPAGATIITYNGSKAYNIASQTGYMISEVLIDGVNDEKAVSSGKYTFSNVTENHTIVVSFKPRTYEITATAGDGGTIAPEGISTITYGNSATYDIVADAGYKIKTVMVDGKNNSAAVNSGVYTFSNVTAKHTIAVTFTAISNAPMAIGDDNQEITLKVYPNPTVGALKIESGKLNMSAIKVFDITGRLVLEVNNVDNNKTEIDLSNYADGVYFIRVDGKTTKVVKR